MPERVIPEWVARVGAEVRDRTEQLPINEPYLVEVTDLLRVISEEEDAQRRRDAHTNPSARISPRCAKNGAGNLGRRHD